MSKFTAPAPHRVTQTVLSPRVAREIAKTTRAPVVPLSFNAPRPTQALSPQAALRSVHGVQPKPNGRISPSRLVQRGVQKNAQAPTKRVSVAQARPTRGLSPRTAKKAVKATTSKAPVAAPKLKSGLLSPTKLVSPRQVLGKKSAKVTKKTKSRSFKSLLPTIAAGRGVILKKTNLVTAASIVERVGHNERNITQYCQVAACSECSTFIEPWVYIAILLFMIATLLIVGFLVVKFEWFPDFASTAEYDEKCPYTYSDFLGGEPIYIDRPRCNCTLPFSTETVIRDDGDDTIIETSYSPCNFLAYPTTGIWVSFFLAFLSSVLFVYYTQSLFRDWTPAKNKGIGSYLWSQTTVMFVIFAGLNVALFFLVLNVQREESRDEALPWTIGERSLTPSRNSSSTHPFKQRFNQT